MDTCSSHQKTYCCRSLWSRLWTALGMLMLFLAAVIVMLRWNPKPIDEDAERALLRTKNLAELREVNAKRLGGYGWIDQTKGIIFIPIARAMELEIAELNDSKRKCHAAYAIMPIDLLPKAGGGLPTLAPAEKKN